MKIITPKNITCILEQKKIVLQHQGNHHQTGLRFELFTDLKPASWHAHLRLGEVAAQSGLGAAQPGEVEGAVDGALPGRAAHRPARMWRMLCEVGDV